MIKISLAQLNAILYLRFPGFKGFRVQKDRTLAAKVNGRIVRIDLFEFIRADGRMLTKASRLIEQALYPPE